MHCIPHTTQAQIDWILARDAQERASQGLSFDEATVVSEETGQELPITGHKVCNHKLLVWHVINGEPELYSFESISKDKAGWKHIYGVAKQHPYTLI